MPPQPAAVTDATETFPRVRRDATRLDVRQVVDFGEPTQQVNVSPIGTHTPARGYAPGGPVDKINQLMDERERAADRRNGRAAARAAHTVREEAARRAATKLKHERHLEVVETIRAYVTLAIFIVLLTIVIGAGVVGYGIIAGFFEWAPVRSH